MGDAAELITVGRLARQAGLTAKAVRHYDRIGLLTPAAVDPATGYRFYAPAQVAQARLIGLLRSVDVPLDRVRACLAAPDDAAEIRRALVEHRRRLQARFDRVRGDLHRIDHLIEAGVTAAGVTAAGMTTSGGTTTVTDHDTVAGQRQTAIDLFNGVWRLLEKEGRGVEDDDRMVHMAHASRYHWGEVGEPVNRSRGEWQCSRVYAVLGRAEPALHHARRGLEICREHGIKDFDLAFAYESLARACAVAGEKEQAREWTAQALAAADDIAEDEDRELLAQFHIDLNAQRIGRYDQDFRFGAGNARGAFWTVDVLESNGFSGPIHFDFKPPRTEDDEGVWVSAAACMRNYLILREKVRAFRADPEVREALRAARLDELAVPTLAAGESWRDVRSFTPDIDTLAARGAAFEHLDQLAIEHLYGVR